MRVLTVLALSIRSMLRLLPTPPRKVSRSSPSGRSGGDGRGVGHHARAWPTSPSRTGVFGVAEALLDRESRAESFTAVAPVRVTPPTARRRASFMPRALTHTTESTGRRSVVDPRLLQPPGLAVGRHPRVGRPHLAVATLHQDHPTNADDEVEAQVGEGRIEVLIAKPQGPPGS